MVWSLSKVATDVQLPSVALLVEHIFKITKDVDGPPMVEVVDVETQQEMLESLVAEICVPVAPVPTKDKDRVEVVLVVLGIAGLFKI